MGKLTKQQQQMVAMVLLLFGGTYAYWNYLLKPTNERIKADQKKLSELSGKIETAERQARRLPALKDEIERLQAELVTLEKQLPKDRDMPNILRILTREALQERIDFVRLAPKGAQQKDYFEIIGFEAQFTGTLHSLARFLASLGQQERIFQAQNVNMTLAGGPSAEGVGVAILNISLTIQTYAYRG